MKLEKKKTGQIGKIGKRRKKMKLGKMSTRIDAGSRLPGGASNEQGNT